MPKPSPKPPLHPVRRRVPPAPPAADYPQRPERFASARTIALSGRGPEDVVADADGRLICGLEGGKIVRLDPRDGRETTLAHTGGRPLGLEVTRDGRILVCDSEKGLLRVDPDRGETEVLVRNVDGVPLRFCSNAASAADGTIWFTESTDSFDFAHAVGSFLEHRPSGRLFRRDPDGRVETVLRDLYFPNGVALSADESTLYFAETADYAIGALATSGPQAGRPRAFIRNLPGFPDNLSRVTDGRIWFALAGPRDRGLDAAGTSPGFLRQILWRLPPLAPAKTVWAMAFDESGAIVDDRHMDRTDFSFATGVAESNGSLYLASPEWPVLLRLAL